MQPIPKLEKPSQILSSYGLSGVGLEGVEVLAGLGLSGRQARVYLALLRAGVSRARSVAVLTSIDRQEVYRLLTSLQELGLVQQNVSAPATFMATPVELAVELLLEQKNVELKFLSKKANQIAKKLAQTQHLTAPPFTPKASFGVITERDGGKKTQIALEQTKQSIEAVTSWAQFRKLCFLLETPLKNALKNGVALSVVAEKPAAHNLPKWVKTATAKYVNFKLKTLHTSPEAVLMIFDQTQTAIAFNVTASFTRGPTLWTTNPHLTAVCRSYFNEVWAKTQP